MMRRGYQYFGLVSRWVLFIVALGWAPAFADGLLHRYEGDVLPYAPGAGWVINRLCQGGCSESLQDGHLVVTYVDQVVAGAFLYNYHHRIALIGEPQPPTLWVEWGFRSEQPLPPFSYTCDGSIAVQYAQWFDVAYLFGDAVVSRSGGQVVGGLDMNEFHTYRFESLDGVHYRMSVDGFVFRESQDDQAISSAFVQFGGDGGCGPEYFPTINEWDFVRYGTVDYGERIVSSDPPGGILNAETYPALDRFTVTFDQPNYLYIDDITVENVATSKSQNVKSTAGAAVPVVIATRRLDNGAPETVEIVLDRPLSVGQTTRFTFATGGTPNVVEYTPHFTGACCLPGGSCEPSSALGCAEGQGIFYEQSDCPPPMPCCLPDGTCASLAPLCCTEHGGTPQEGVCDADADDDGIDATCGDACPNDPDKLSPGQCGCGVPEFDNDADTVADCLDQCPNADDRLDEDGDGVPDCALGLARIPTISMWGLTMLTLSLLIAAKILFRGGKPVPLRA